MLVPLWTWHDTEILMRILRVDWLSRHWSWAINCSVTNICWKDPKIYTASFHLISLHMMTSSNGNIYRVTGHLCGEFTGHLRIPRTEASDAFFDVFFDLRLNEWFNKQSWGWLYETPWRPLWGHCNDLIPRHCIPPYVMLHFVIQSNKQKITDRQLRLYEKSLSGKHIYSHLTQCVTAMLRWHISNITRV